MREVYEVRKVFTPSKPARVAFVERDQINNALVNALRTPGKQIVVYGYSGSGKTTLLVNKLHQVYPNHITTRCMKGLTFDQLILDAFDQLAPYYSSETTKTQRTSQASELLVTYNVLVAKLSASEGTDTTEKRLRILPPQLTPQNLARLIGAAGCCWVLEDFHKIDDSEKTRLSQLMKVFMDMSDEYEDLKIIALGAVDTARQVVDYDREMKNRVAEIRVDLMQSTEIAEIIKKGEEALNIRFHPKISASISAYCGGLAAVCHHLCLNICDAAGIQHTQSGDTPIEIPAAHITAALEQYVKDSSDSMKSSFDLALKKERKSKYPNAELILRTLCKVDVEGLARADILRKIRESVPKFPNSNLEHYLKKLQQEEYGALIRFSPLSNCYTFSDPFFKVFAMVHFQDSMSVPHWPEINAKLSTMLSQLIERTAKFRKELGE
jgi:GTPase SAR1 family protein